MKVLIRKTVSGTEYWNTEAKKTLLVPKGSKPDFEVTENPKSMIQQAKQIGKVTKEGAKELADAITNSNEADLKLEEMNTSQLMAFAEKNDINVPGNMKKLETIRKFITDQLAAESK